MGYFKFKLDKPDFLGFVEGLLWDLKRMATNRYIERQGSMFGQMFPKITTQKEHPIHQIIQIKVGAKFIRASSEPQVAVQKHNSNSKQENTAIAMLINVG